MNYNVKSFHPSKDSYSEFRPSGIILVIFDYMSLFKNMWLANNNQHTENRKEHAHNSRGLISPRHVNLVCSISLRNKRVLPLGELS